MKTSYQQKPKIPTAYRTEHAARNTARRLVEAGKKAYVYQCDDCHVKVHGRVRDPYGSNRMYEQGEITELNAWHVGIDTGAPHHVDRHTHHIPEYKWDRDAQDWLSW